MPLHVFECPRCHHRFEELVRPDERPACPECGTAETERQLPRIAVSTSSRNAPEPGMGPCGGCPDAGACGFDG